MAATDIFNANRDISAPAGSFAAITPSDATELGFLTRAVYVGTGGNVVAVDAAGTAVTFTAVVGGTILPIRVSRINSTNTTASNMVALW